MPRTAWAENAACMSGDRIELVHFVGGGSADSCRRSTALPVNSCSTPLPLVAVVDPSTDSPDTFQGSLGPHAEPQALGRPP